MTNTGSRGLALASMVAAMFAGTACGGGGQDAAVAETEAQQQAIVKCEGINSCAGQGACAGVSPAGVSHDCAGHNACAGQGWIEVARSECSAKGGVEKS